jgi:hypothetical protein
MSGAARLLPGSAALSYNTRNSCFARGIPMASHNPARYTGPETIEALVADRQKMWAGFTVATTGTVIFMAVLLIGMAFFLL